MPQIYFEEYFCEKIIEIDTTYISMTIQGVEGYVWERGGGGGGGVKKRLCTNIQGYKRIFKK
jgi:hypothetical protein